MHRTKCTEMINGVLAPYFLKKLVADVVGEVQLAIKAFEGEQVDPLKLLDSLVSLIKSVSSRVLNPLANIDVLKEPIDGYISPSPYLGYLFESKAAELLLAPEEKNQVRKRCVAFTISLTHELRLRLPDNIEALPYMSVFNRHSSHWKFSIRVWQGQQRLSLSHSNAEVERLFRQMSVVKSKLRNRMSLQTLNSILYVRYGLKLAGIEGPGKSHVVLQFGQDERILQAAAMVSKDAVPGFGSFLVLTASMYDVDGQTARALSTQRWPQNDKGKTNHSCNIPEHCRNTFAASHPTCTLRSVSTLLLQNNECRYQGAHAIFGWQVNHSETWHKWTSRYTDSPSYTWLQYLYKHRIQIQRARRDEPPRTSGPSGPPDIYKSRADQPVQPHPKLFPRTTPGRQTKKLSSLVTILAICPTDSGETNSESDSGDGNPPDDRQIPLDLQRLKNVEWCTCGCCRADDLETVQECGCCRELAKVQALNGNHGGPASHSTLTVCLNEYVLDVAYSYYQQNHGHLNKSPHEYNLTTN
ncbi:hypothetical protein KUCAC02_025136 [Chaenocephalus aceratus]|nr:hypothetical protein KUCAC02_025136 [Chaenocephalus aceratus]